MDSGSSDVGEGGRGIGIISGLSTRGSGRVDNLHSSFALNVNDVNDDDI